MHVALFAAISFIAFQLVQLIYVVCQAVVGWRIGATVEAIAVGCGPNLWVRDIRGVEWRIGAIPMGGYTTFYGHGADDDRPPREPNDPRVPMDDLPVGGRLLLLLVGPLSTLLIGMVLVAVPIALKAEQVVVGSQTKLFVEPTAVPDLGTSESPASWGGQRELLGNTFLEFWRRVFLLESLRGWGGFFGAMITCGAAMVASPLVWMSCFGVICVGTALANLLPIPIMNGGHIMFLVVEAVFGRIPERIKTGITVPFILVVLFAWGHLAWTDLSWCIDKLGG